MPSSANWIRLPRGAGIDREAAGIAIRIQVAEDGIHQSLALADGLDRARPNAPAKQRIQDVPAVAPLVRDGVGGYADADLHLLQRFLITHDDARRWVRRGVVVSILNRRQVLEVTPHQLHERLV